MHGRVANVTTIHLSPNYVDVSKLLLVVTVSLTPLTENHVLGATIFLCYIMLKVNDRKCYAVVTSENEKCVYAYTNKKLISI